MKVTVFERADRILDAAGELILRLGYRKVNVEDIAAQAGVGKGTIYLHWRTKDELYEALLLRESIKAVREFIAMLRDDPAEARPCRFARASFLGMTRRPLLHALVTGDPDILGKLTKSPLRSHELLASERLFSVSERYGLLRSDVPNAHYTVGAATTGFYLLDGPGSVGAELEAEARADALEFTVRHAFEPAEEPSPDVLAAAAAEYIDIFQQLIPPYQKWIYE